MADVTIRNLSKHYGAVEVMSDIDLDIRSGEFVVFVGPSGCGKSTLLRMISGLEEESGGSIEIDGRDVTGVEPSERGVAMVFQSYALYPHLTVAENIGFSLSLARVPKDEMRRKIEEAANILQLGPLLERKPKHLSGGQRQRVAIGRAIVRDPKVFLFDEPLSNLDAALRTQMRLELGELHQRLNTTMIYVTHDQVEAMTMADRIVVLNGGRIEQVGTPTELYRAPRSPFVAGFIGSPKMNLFEGPVAEAEGAEVLGLRPEHIVVDATGPWSGDVRLIEHLGAEAIAHVDTPEAGRVIIRLDGEAEVRTGDHVRLTPRPDRMHRFRAGQRLA
ncbi:ABC sorbitol/mannitol transporter, ATPase subunit [Oceanicola granulosus HTCC2516]|uniref:ABC sorbitol/mannitol transporter, ATPase subunit n=1 Tax=Oceanicola granulosus (strain ATCC BAA-861 / DSM 15982 / KCTC 12143 / HTCC2516) TaxID=314256 RepID=Q2CH56_OCEGH|nr:ATP-binding cassette domain-containing protein [Oceanicola granulosus]EAR51955.1 ABC sorbitol/mannitol transporter, ATPase subunit [Oceanicola granulosus HTCC2516]